MSWTDERTEALCKFWSLGTMSASSIAGLLGTTRNAVLGKVHRMGLSNRAPSVQPRAKTAPHLKRKRLSRPSMPKIDEPTNMAFRSLPRSEKRLPAIALPPAIPGEGVGVLALARTDCRWPDGEPGEPDFGFYCKATAEPGRPYCAAHCAAAYQPYKAPARPSRRGKQGYKSRMRA